MNDDATGDSPALPQIFLAIAKALVAPYGDEAHGRCPRGRVQCVQTLGDSRLVEVIRAIGILQVRDDHPIDLGLSRVGPGVAQAASDVTDGDRDPPSFLRPVKILARIVVGGKDPVDRLLIGRGLRGLVRLRRRLLVGGLLHAVRVRQGGALGQRVTGVGSLLLQLDTDPVLGTKPPVEHERNRQGHGHGQLIVPVQHAVDDLLRGEDRSAVDILAGEHEGLP